MNSESSSFFVSYKMVWAKLTQTAFNKPEEFILAIVEVDGAETHTVYLKEPFNGIDRPGFMEVSRNFSIVELVQNAKIVYQK